MDIFDINEIRKLFTLRVVPAEWSATIRNNPLKRGGLTAASDRVKGRRLCYIRLIDTFRGPFRLPLTIGNLGVP